MPLAHLKFFEEPREFTEEQIAELHAGHLLRDDPPVPSGLRRDYSGEPAVSDEPATAGSEPPAE